MEAMVPNRTGARADFYNGYAGSKPAASGLGDRTQFSLPCEERRLLEHVDCVERYGGHPLFVLCFKFERV